MIHEDDEYFEDPIIDFSWILVVGRTRLGLVSDREVMRLTWREFMNRYRAYQRLFDVETMLQANRTTYAAVQAKQEREEEWF